jgi:hypothetical protein
VLVSRKWSGKSLADHRHDRRAFVHQVLTDLGVAPDTDVNGSANVRWENVAPGDNDVPPRAHLLLHAVSERIRWKAQYNTALLAAQGEKDSGSCKVAA